MRYFVAAFAFVLTLGLTTKTIASAPPSDASCTPENTAQCAPAHAAAHTGEGHGDHGAVMNSLFPEKKANPEVARTPATVELLTPKFLAKVEGAAHLEWKEVSGADAYHLQVATDPNFKWLLVNDHFVKGTSFEFDKAEAGKKYFWRVAAYNTHNDSMFNKSLFNSSAFVAK